MKTLVGIVTFGNRAFTELAIRELLATCRAPFDLFVVIGKPGDLETRHLVDELEGDDAVGFNDCRHLIHESNRGFPASINDIYDEAWTFNDYDQVILMGNDVVPLPGAIDAMITEAARGEFDWICGAQFDVKSLCERYPEARRHFHGTNFDFNDFNARPWELHEPTRLRELEDGMLCNPNTITDVRNLCLFKRAVFERLGYADVNFWPGGYFEDNDYFRRARLLEIKACTLRSAAYFHFWSRTIHQGEGTTDRLFERNRAYYREKWGGLVNEETFAQPFNDEHTELAIRDRTAEVDQVRYWQTKT